MLKRIVSKRWVRVALVVACGLAALVVSACWYLGIWGYGDLIAYGGMYMECHPVWKDLALRRVYSGQSVDELISLSDPPVVERHGRYVHVNYQNSPEFARSENALQLTGITIVAQDGKLVQAVAWSCAWSHTFFNTLSPQEQRAGGVLLRSTDDRPRGGDE